REHLAFRVRSSNIEPIRHPSISDPEDLRNVDRQKEILFRNTEQFVMGFPANDVLLWGERGTGKSSLVRSLLHTFGSRGLRLIQVYKWDIPSLTDLYDILRDREERFILFFDDLSFEPNEDTFRLLKSILDGDLEERPENVLVYATSNRRHLIPDVEREEKFPSESLQERISLIDRFGIRLGFFAFDKERYLDIVRHYVRKRGLSVNGEELEREALRWATERGSFSGRTAYQFVKDLEGRIRLSSLSDRLR
ncbi:MAG: ATP-binding protein, partial [Aquifex sp.]